MNEGQRRRWHGILAVFLAGNLGVAYGEARFLSGSFQYGANCYERQFEQTIERVLQESGIDEAKTTVQGAIVFGRTGYPVQPQNVAVTFSNVLKKRNKDAVIAGSAGLNGAYLANLRFLPSVNEFSFLVICGEDVKLKSQSVAGADKDSINKAKELAKQIKAPDTKLAVIFVPNKIYSAVNISDLTAVVHGELGAQAGVMVIGVDMTACFVNGEAQGGDDRIAGFTVSGKIAVGCKVVSSFKEVAGPFKVTKIEQDKLMEVDNTLAYQVFAEKCNLVMDGLKNKQTNNDFAFCRKAGEMLLPLGQEYEKGTKCFKVLNAVGVGQEVYIGTPDAGLRSSMAGTLSKGLTGHQGKKGGVIFMNGFANWQSFRKSVEEYQALQEAVGKDMAVSGFYVKDYLLSIPAGQGVEKYANPNVGIAVTLVSQ